MKRFFLNKIVVIAVLLAAVSCEELEIENEINADLAKSLSNTNEYSGIVDGQFSLLFQMDTYFHTHTLSTMGDGMSMSWGNWGCRELSVEPREAIPNSATWNYAYVLSDPWSSYYSIIGSISDVMRQYKENPDYVTYGSDGTTDITYQVKAKAKFLQGAAYGSLSKIFDKGKVVTEHTDLAIIPEMEYSDYMAMRDTAVALLDEAITYANSGGDFTVGVWNGVTLDRDQFVAVCKSFQAKIIVQNSRTDAENAAVNWSDVLAKTTAGTQVDLAPQGDGGTSWYDYFMFYGNEEGWSRVDMRIVSMLDPNQPSRFPVDGTTSIGEAASDDARMASYWTYYESIPFRAERGYYHYSHYDMSRYDYHYPDWSGAMPYLTTVENNLLKAEAMLWTGDNASAADLINATRVTNGNLAGLTGSESTADMLDALFYERFVELLSTSPGSVYYDRRRLPEDDGSYAPLGGLQPCTARNFPIPASELQLLSLDVYTFGEDC